MSDLIDDPKDGLNDPEFTVSEISGAIKRLIEGEFSHVRLKGEIGRVSFPRSGHVYLDLKDEKAVISAVIWKGVAARLQIQPEEGMEVVATGRVTTFGGQSKYQLVIEQLKPAGVGALMAMLEKRKAVLAAEGLFQTSHKKQIPSLPEVIGVVTSPSGSVIRDILHRLRDRFPRKVLIWPVAVQGDRCAPEVSAAIAGFNRFSPGASLPRPDLIIVARGGGSLEDLWGFNEEAVARAAFASEIPLISAVGHETDTTLIDYVADHRAPTPTAAAELAVPVRHELLATLESQEARMSRAMSTVLTTRGQRMWDVARALPRLETLLENPRQKLDHLADRLPAGLKLALQQHRVKLTQFSGVLRPAALKNIIMVAKQQISSLSPRLEPALLRGIDVRKTTFENTQKRLDIRPLERVLVQDRKDLDQLSKRLSDTGLRHISQLGEQLTALDRLRETLGYKATLKRGYAVVRADQKVVTSKDQAAKSDSLEIEFKDGKMKLWSGGGAKPARAKSSPDQGSLF
ncbi:MAG: exodeoxyribonuclease VII large subunit [Marinovum sp.]|nr:exodeoxyribonuclease VII large subunit [Marinovum sp.]